jgi:hypothetical protein
MIRLGLNEPAKADPAAAPSADTLQFRKAEIVTEATGRACTVCQQPVSGEYYQINGADGCASCAKQVIAIQQRRGGWTEFGRAALFGLGAAIAGALLFAIVSYATHMTFSLLAIVVGVMVAKAVLIGSRGCRGRRFQVLAVLLTYGSITTSYIPDLIAGIANSAGQAEGRDAQKLAAPSATPTPAKPVSGAQLALGLAFLTGIALVAPFLMLTDISGIINLVIIGIGLMQAWRRTRPIQAVVVGPYAAS